MILVIVFFLGLAAAMLAVFYRLALVEQAAAGVADEPWLDWDGEDPPEIHFDELD